MVFLEKQADSGVRLIRCQLRFVPLDLSAVCTLGWVGSSDAKPGSALGQSGCHHSQRCVWSQSGRSHQRGGLAERVEIPSGRGPRAGRWEEYRTDSTQEVFFVLVFS